MILDGDGTRNQRYKISSHIDEFSFNMKRRKKKSPSPVEDKFGKIYYDPASSGGYGGVKRLMKASKSKKATVTKWLQGEDTYTLHRNVKRNFKRRKVIVASKDQYWQADLIDVSNLHSQNRPYKFLLTCIDVFSKFAWVKPLKNKTGQSLVDAFTEIFSSGRVCLFLFTDSGTEFKNKLFRDMLKQYSVEHITSQNVETKASVSERFNRTLKSRLWRYFTKNGTLRYIEVLPKVVTSYNNSFHSAIKMAPNEVTPRNFETVWQNLYGNRKSKSQPGERRTVFVIGDCVRVARAKREFKKGYLPKWTEEIFTIVRVLRTHPVTYYIADDKGEVLRGSFYHDELQKVMKRDNVYRIDKILKVRRRGKKTEYLVSWKGYSESENSWVDKKDVYDV